MLWATARRVPVSLLWESAEKYRVLSGRYSDVARRNLLELASSTIARIAEDVEMGRGVNVEDVEALESIIRLLRVYGLPRIWAEKALRVARRGTVDRATTGSLLGYDLLGLPA
ncbi:MAG: hypothetical protein LRS48_00530 [Desulfurococcales archaeon]|nr:hypothetical protein [Desulfurococcales archaeon]